MTFSINLNYLNSANFPILNSNEVGSYYIYSLTKSNKYMKWCFFQHFLNIKCVLLIDFKIYANQGSISMKVPQNLLKSIKDYFSSLIKIFQKTRFLKKGSTLIINTF